MGTRTAEAFIEKLLHSLIDDFVNLTQPNHVLRNKTYISRRLSCEGTGFATKILPQLAKAVEYGLESGSFICPANFSKPNNTALPHFMKDLLLRVFNKSGNLLTTPCVESIYALRTIGYIVYKTVFPFTEKQLDLAEKKFIATDDAIPNLGRVLDTADVLVLEGLDVARGLITRLFEGFDPHDISPSFGPGITAGGDEPHEKPYFRTKYEGIHNEYPYYRFFHVSPISIAAHPFDYWKRNRKVIGTNKVLFVPKDSRGPRTIACEPVEYMWIQQGLRKKLYEHVECHPLTKGQISFTDQTINQRGALSASMGDGMATLDMKDASDSVGAELVDYLFSDLPKLKRCLAALRTPESLLPSGEVKVLKKYAAMGSALCFPVEAIVFWALARASIYLYNRFVAPIRSVIKPKVSVYGDDILIHADAVPMFVDLASKVGLHTNLTKSFFRGQFRESCGHDYYAGINITTIKVRNIDLSDQGNSIASLVETANFLRGSFLHNAANTLEEYIPVDIPNGNPDSPYLCYSSQRFPRKDTGITILSSLGTFIVGARGRARTRWNNKLQYQEKRVPFLKGVKYSFYQLCDRYEYLRKMTIGWGEEFESHLYAKRQVSLNYKYVQVER